MIRPWRFEERLNAYVNPVRSSPDPVPILRARLIPSVEQARASARQRQQDAGGKRFPDRLQDSV